ACLTGMPEVALELLKLDPVKDNAHVDNNLALKYACCKGLKEVALELLEQPKVRELAHAHGFFGVDNEALIEACKNGMVEVALKLLDQEEVRNNIKPDHYCIKDYYDQWKKNQKHNASSSMFFQLPQTLFRFFTHSNSDRKDQEFFEDERKSTNLAKLNLV
ncbi:MAG TPA: hypothetical protein QF353_04565, partial [Gammaproteobacteria bacterium]|nr:hypothetical protein [Gammaproteobacteria bacterium]